MIARSHAPRLFVLYVFGMVLASMFDYEITAYLAREALWANVLEIADIFPEPGKDTWSDYRIGLTILSEMP